MKAHRDPEQLEPKKAPEGWFPDVRTLPAPAGSSVECLLRSRVPTKKTKVTYPTESGVRLARIGASAAPVLDLDVRD